MLMLMRSLMMVVVATLAVTDCPWLSESSVQTAEVAERRSIALVRA
jgi:hypothetical protein